MKPLVAYRSSSDQLHDNTHAISPDDNYDFRFLVPSPPVDNNSDQVNCEGTKETEKKLLITLQMKLQIKLGRKIILQHHQLKRHQE